MVKYYINQKNNANNEACIVKINNHRYHALKPNKNKYIELKELLKQFTYKELTVCSCHVTYTFESESTLYSCLNVKELLARSRREI